ncbi:hypothetical protein [Streptomyces sp. NPDC056061]|uniref:hypothetical protein n=1 Tax=Streptomyces sp. NPDC056061 TaxID=3345700 RepID=UPI0035D8C0E4
MTGHGRGGTRQAPAAVTGVVAADGAVCVDLDGPAGEAWRQCADVLYGSRPRPGAEAEALALRTLGRYPGCRLAVIRRDDGCCVTASDSARDSVTVTTCARDSASGTESVTAAASVTGPFSTSTSTATTASVALGRPVVPGAPPPGSVSGPHDVPAPLVGSPAPSPEVTPREGRRVGAGSPPGAARPSR